MTFSDDDLKRFREWINDCYESDKFYCRTREIEALLSRLEAAELPTDALEKNDPVYGPVKGPNRTSIRICALCKRRSSDQQENVTHTPECPWILARAWRKAVGK